MNRPLRRSRGVEQVAAAPTREARAGGALSFDALYRSCRDDVHAYVVGEHGDSELPLWSTATVGSVPLLDWRGADGSAALDDATQQRIARDVVESAYRVIEGKGATNYAIGLAATRIVEAVVYDERRILPVSSLLDDYYGIGDVCLSVPAVVHSGGVGERVEVPMTDAELEEAKNELLPSRHADSNLSRRPASALGGWSRAYRPGVTTLMPLARACVQSSIASSGRKSEFTA